MFGKKCIFVVSGRGNDWADIIIGSVFCFRPEKRNRQFQPKGWKDMTLICFVYVSVQPMLYPHNKTAWEYCSYSFLSEAFAMPVFR